MVGRARSSEMARAMVDLVGFVVSGGAYIRFLWSNEWNLAGLTREKGFLEKTGGGREEIGKRGGFVLPMCGRMFGIATLLNLGVTPARVVSIDSILFTLRAMAFVLGEPLHHSRLSRA